MSEGKRISKMDRELDRAGIKHFAGLPYYDPDGRPNDRVSLARLPLRWVVTQGFWDRYLEPLIQGNPTMRIEYGGWPIEIGPGSGEWARIEAVE